MINNLLKTKGKNIIKLENRKVKYDIKSKHQSYAEFIFYQYEYKFSIYICVNVHNC